MGVAYSMEITRHKQAAWVALNVIPEEFCVPMLPASGALHGPGNTKRKSHLGGKTKGKIKNKADTFSTYRKAKQPKRV